MAVADTAGNVSPPTVIQIGVPVDAEIPEVCWLASAWKLRGLSDGVLSDWPVNGVVPDGQAPVLQLGWMVETLNPSFLLAVRPQGSQQTWTDVDLAGTLDTSQAPTYRTLDPDADSASASEYRLMVRSSAGVWSGQDQILPVLPPGQP
jgi:hypothetical protein